MRLLFTLLHLIGTPLVIVGGYFLAISAMGEHIVNAPIAGIIGLTFGGAYFLALGALADFFNI